MVAEVREEPGALPLLQYALTEVYEQREDRYLTLHGYQQTGGVFGALANRAEEVFVGLSVEQQQITRQLFLRLVTLGEGAEDTRRRVRTSELMAIGEVSPILDNFGRYRLLTFDRELDTRQPTIEIAHEALIRKWDRFRDWLDDSRVDIQLQRLLATAAADWRVANQDASYLLQGARLAQYAEWSETMNLVLTPDEQTFLQASFEEDHRQKQLEEDRRQQELMLQQRAANRLRLLAGSLTVFLIVALGLSVFAFDQQRQAVEQAGTATVAQGEALVQAITATNAQGEAFNQAGTATVAQGDALNQAATAQAAQNDALNQAATATNAQGEALNQAATAQAAQFQAEQSAAENQSLALAGAAQNALLSGRHDVALSLAYQANNIIDIPSVEARLILLDAMATTRISQRYVGHDEPIIAVSITPDGTTMISGTVSGEIIIWDVQTGTIRHQLNAHSLPITDIVAISNNEQFVSAAEDGTVALWDIETGRPVRRLEGAPGLFTGALLQSLGGFIINMAVSPDGRYIALSKGGGFDLKNLETNDEIATASGRLGEHTAIIFSPDSNRILFMGDAPTESTDTVTVPSYAMAIEPGNIIEWDIKTQEVIRQFEGRITTSISLMLNQLVSLQYSDDEEWLFSASADGDIIIWDAQTTEELYRYQIADSLNYAVLSSSKRYVATVGSDNRVLLHDATTGAILQAFLGHSNPSIFVTFTPDDSALISASQDGTLIRWQLEEQGVVRDLQEATDYEWDELVFHPDTRSGLFLDPQGTNEALWWSLDEDIIELRQAEEAEALLSGTINAISNELVAYYQHDFGTSMTIYTSDLSVHKPIAFGAHMQTSIAFSPNGQLFAVGTGDGQLIVSRWNTEPDVELGEERGDFLRIESGPEVPLTALAFSSDGQYVVAGTARNILLLWDLETGQIIQQFEGHTRTVVDVAFSPDGTQIISGSEDSLAILWDVESGELIHRLEGHDSTVNSVTFSPDAQYVVTGSDDSTALLWNVASGEPLRRYVYDSPVIGVRYSIDGETILAGTASGLLRVQDGLPYQGGVETWVTQNLYVPELTCEQRVLYNIVPLCRE